MATVQRIDDGAAARRKVTAEILDRQPPRNLEAEKGVLGSIMLMPEVCDEVALIIRAAGLLRRGEPKALRPHAGDARRRAKDRSHAARRAAEILGRFRVDRRRRLSGRGRPQRAARGQRRVLRRDRSRQGHPAVADPFQHRHPPRRLRRIERRPRDAQPGRGKNLCDPRRKRHRANRDRSATSSRRRWSGSTPACRISTCRGASRPASKTSIR